MLAGQCNLRQIVSSMQEPVEEGINLTLVLHYVPVHNNAQKEICFQNFSTLYND